MVLAGLFAKVTATLSSKFIFNCQHSWSNNQHHQFSLMTYNAFQSRSGFCGLFFTKSTSQYLFQTRWLIFFVLQKQYELFWKLIYFCTTNDPQANSSFTRKQRELQQLHQDNVFCSGIFQYQYKATQSHPHTSPLNITLLHT